MKIKFSRHALQRMIERAPQVPQKNYEIVVKLALQHDEQTRTNPLVKDYLTGLEKNSPNRKAVVSQRHAFILELLPSGDYNVITVLNGINAYHQSYVDRRKR